MRGQRYRARDKTVRKMGRDGLSKENLKSGEAVRISSREPDYQTLPRAADDSMNFRNRRGHGADGRNAEERRRGGYSSDFRRPENEETGSVQSGLYRTELKEAESSSYKEEYKENTEQAGADTRNAQAVCADREDISKTEPGMREISGRQNGVSSYNRTSGRRRNHIPEPSATRYRRQRRSVQESLGGRAESSDTGQGSQADNSSGSSSGTGSGNAPDTGMGISADTGESTMPGVASNRVNAVSSAHGSQPQSSRMENIRDGQAGRGGDFGADGKEGRDHSHDRKKKQVYDYARKTEGQKKTEEGKNAQKKTGQERLSKEQEKKTERLRFEEEGGMVRGAGMRLAGRAAVRAAGLAVSTLADGGQEEEQEDMGTEALRRAGRAGDKTFRYALRPASNRMKKNRRAGEELSEAGRKKVLNKFYQKQRIKKAYEKAKQGEKTAEGAVKSAGTFLGKAKSIAAEVFRNKKGLLMAVVFLLLFFLFFAASFLSCSAMVQGASSTFIGTTYPSEDEDIYDAEAAYQALEEALDEQIGSMEIIHPGYDEYRYQVDEITHNPYQLISFLTVLYEEFTYAQIESMDMLPVFFSEQYRLTVEEVTEIRTRTQTVTDPLTGEETEQEEEYEWRVLCICLTNRGFDTVARSHMTQEQAALYDAYNMTYGNRSYLFDVAGIPADSPGGDGYEIPAEALSDEQFARMIQEAEKYLGRAYVWGGDSPETGFDCSGFVSWVINNSGNGWNVGRQTAEGLRRNCTAVSASAAKPGDLIFFQGTYNTSGASHVGIYVGNGMMIHAGNPVKYSNINTPYWQGHFLSYGRIG